MPKMKNSATAGNRPRKYPTRCTECGKAALRPVVIHREVKKNHDGRVYLLAINDLPVPRCGDCGEARLSDRDRPVRDGSEYGGRPVPARLRPETAAFWRRFYGDGLQ